MPFCARRSDSLGGAVGGLGQGAAAGGCPTGAGEEGGSGGAASVDLRAALRQKRLQKQLQPIGEGETEGGPSQPQQGGGQGSGAEWSAKRRKQARGAWH